ncbi:NACHT domain-containing protein [Kitasatospora sp. NPDC006697]|uniref:NACHT domain-containing protein n=1 Tax=Kitasatospora sp. NPDC006697 TaxID=3364020 RepID=UPI00367D4FE9
MGPPQPAEQVLTHHPLCVVLGGPGAGKSSALRTHLSNWLASGRRQGAPAPAPVSGPVPVLVNAAALAGGRPLPEALARAATADLTPHGLEIGFPRDFFLGAPHPGSRWLVMVDGLDEIADPHTRHEVLTSIAEHGRSEGPYRFAIASRHLPEGELDALGAGVPHYELQPFTRESIPGFAQRWFEALNVAEPASAATEFARAVARTGLSELSRTPLMCTMLCQLYALDRQRDLPVGRSAVYRRFTDLLRERQHARGEGGITVQTESALGRYGPAALERANHVLDRALDLIGHLAAQRHAGETRPAIAIIAAHPACVCPDRVPEDIWTEFLATVLRGSGLLVKRAADYIFLHQTLLEYLAARHVVKEAMASENPAGVIRQMGWGRGSWWPSDDYSFAGFLIDAWAGQDFTPVARALRRLAARRGLKGRQFIAGQVELGTVLPPEVIEQAVAGLRRLVHQAHSFRNPLTELAKKAHSAEDRYAAAHALWKIDERQGRNALLAVADDKRDVTYCCLAARDLDELGDPRGGRILATIATDDNLTVDSRRRAAKELALPSADGTRPPDPRGRKILAALATNPEHKGLDRCRAARDLGDLGDPRGQQVLAAIATNPEHDGPTRCEAASDLAELGDPQGPEVLAAIATDPEYGGPARRDAANRLVRLGDSQGLKAMIAIATSAQSPADVYETATDRAKLGDRQGLALLATVAINPDLYEFLRRRAARTLRSKGYPLSRKLTRMLVMDANLAGLKFTFGLLMLSLFLLAAFGAFLGVRNLAGVSFAWAAQFVGTSSWKGTAAWCLGIGVCTAAALGILGVLLDRGWLTESAGPVLRAAVLLALAVFVGSAPVSYLAQRHADTTTVPASVSCKRDDSECAYTWWFEGKPYTQRADTLQVPEVIHIDPAHPSQSDLPVSPPKGLLLYARGAGGMALLWFTLKQFS